jgi:hypothetical protein
MTEIFVDTSAWYAIAVASGPAHNRPRQWLTSNTVDLVTTDFIVDELLTLLRFRREHRKALELGAEFFGDRLARIEWVTPEDVLQAWQVFQDFPSRQFVPLLP